MDTRGWEMTEIRFASFTVAATAPLHSAGNNTMVNLLFPCPSLATPLKILVSDKLLRFEQNRSIKMQKKKSPINLYWLVCFGFHYCLRRLSVGTIKATTIPWVSPWNYSKTSPFVSTCSSQVEDPAWFPQATVSVSNSRAFCEATVPM